MEIKLDSKVIQKLTARGILAYVAMSISPKGNLASDEELAAAINVEPATLKRRESDTLLLQNLDFTKKRQPRKKSPVKFVLPDWIPQEVWDGFVEGRRRKHGAPTDYAAYLIVKTLEREKANGQDPIEMLNQSARRGWADVFPIRADTFGTGLTPPPMKLQPTEFKR
jgi:hypothetical protein